ncbi:MAG: ClC family H(+)/Cl(-) exchange transporter [Fastidiosipilaceae bacterium]|jgi:H+/Cl- antiporter ClcA|nr:ClC family H(+)/Cl(-) exchange transporter [Clostridiaceae bacterium]
MSQTVKEIANRSRLHLNLLWEAALVGVVVGIIVTLYRLGIQFISDRIITLMGIAAGSFANKVIFVGVMLIFGVLAGLCYRLSPLISGSGIPQVAAQLGGHLQSKWQSVLPFKFIGGLLTLGGGLTLGREGPSVQIGASIGQGCSDLLRRPISERRYMIVGGASAGLAAAFNAPIAGAIFALEEMHHHFSPRALISAMTAAFSANFIAGLVMSDQPVLFFDHVAPLPLKHYLTVVLIGIVTGFSGVLFNRCILWGKKIYQRLRLHWVLTGIIPFLIVAICGLILPDLFGSGEHLIFLPVEGGYNFGYLLMLFVVKLILLTVCFCSGLPGGIFFPMLVLGSLCGHGIGLLLADAGMIETQYILTLSLMAMAGHFSSIVRAPMTGLLLVSEMTGSFANMLPLGIVSLVAYIVAEACKSEPIYISLEKQLPLSAGPEALYDTNERMLMEFAVENNSYVDGRKIADVCWPTDFMLVAVRRSGKEITPTGSLELKAGDYIVALFIRQDMAGVVDELNEFTKTL